MFFNIGALLADRFSEANALRAVNVARSRPSARTAYLTAIPNSDFDNGARRAGK
jgi:hypothetical protein